MLPQKKGEFQFETVTKYVAIPAILTFAEWPPQMGPFRGKFSALSA